MKKKDMFVESALNFFAKERERAALEEGIEQGREETALGLLEAGLDADVIRKATRLPKARIEKLRKAAKKKARA